MAKSCLLNKRKAVLISRRDMSPLPGLWWRHCHPTCSVPKVPRWSLGLHGILWCLVPVSTSPDWVPCGRVKPHSSEPAFLVQHLTPTCLLKWVPEFLACMPGQIENMHTCVPRGAVGKLSACHHPFGMIVTTVGIRQSRLADSVACCRLPHLAGPHAELSPLCLSLERDELFSLFNLIYTNNIPLFPSKHQSIVFTEMTLTLHPESHLPHSNRYHCAPAIFLHFPFTSVCLSPQKIFNFFLCGLILHELCHTACVRLQIAFSTQQYVLEIPRDLTRSLPLPSGFALNDWMYTFFF